MRTKLFVFLDRLFYCIVYQPHIPRRCRRPLVPKLCVCAVPGEVAHLPALVAPQVPKPAATAPTHTPSPGTRTGMSHLNLLVTDVPKNEQLDELKDMNIDRYIDSNNQNIYFMLV